ncbi:hypothetical protein F4861DRAFT_196754 [Xylaria intraflava]|nr:hypothetical protein F4861DRAFT_196754 [Xylaria intraflava]
MVTRKPQSESPPSVNDVNTAGTPHVEASSSGVDLEQVWGGSEPAVAGHDQVVGIQNPDISRQVQVPLSPSTSSVATSVNPSLEHVQRNPWEDVSKGVDTPDSADNTSHTSHTRDQSVARSETNPFKRKPVQTLSKASDSTQKGLNESGTASEPTTEAFSLSQADKHSESSTNPWQPILSERKGSDLARTSQSLPDQDSGRDVWGAGSEPKSDGPSLIPSESTGNVKLPSSPDPAPGDAFDMINLLDDVNAWQEEQSGDREKQPAALQPNNQPDTNDNWSLTDRESNSGSAIINNSSKQGSSVDAKDGTAQGLTVHDTKETAAASSTTLLDVPPPQPPRRQSPTNVNMSETYQIKIINWYDASAANNPRNSPILVQNANGPCPLVALVNALILTTPADRHRTELVETLKSREQISLKFLLELVVDELMSFRHTESNVPLPDMSELYAFLQGLHTGMNVNPRFVPPLEVNAADKHIIPSDVDIPGTFEKTRDMELYATFSIPLIHGWLPPKDGPAYNALMARASSYDDAQNLLFREEELELKFSNSQTGLTEEEQQLYQDIITIKSFLSTTATQLTPSGLDIITKSIKPGGVSILFRNDHFSTLYRHPKTLRLYTLVTDAGYFTHDEVVWESLVDVRGELAEFLSGDFRLVSSTQHERVGSSTGAQHNPGASEDGWQTVQNRRARNNRQSEPAPPTTTLLSQHEQEDRDLALALQLQEEEDERHRTEQDARRRERHLSEQFIEQQGRGGGQAGLQSRGGSLNGPNRGGARSSPPPRSSSVNQPARAGQQTRGVRSGQQVRSLIPPRTYRAADDGLEDAPPSYEQAAKSTPYLPPSGHPSHPDSSPRSANPRRRQMPVAQGNAEPSTPSRSRQSAPSVTAGGSSGGSGKDKDCCVM